MKKHDLLIRNENIQHIFDWYSLGQFMVNRKYQRKLVWSLQEKQKLINSIANNFPIPLFLLAKNEKIDNYEIIDGMQRLEAIFSFLIGDFPVQLDDCFGYFDLNTMAKTKEMMDNSLIKQNYPVLDRTICTVISNYQLPLSISSFPDKEIEEIFRRINSTGRQLSKQDLRQAGVIGDFSNLVRKLACYIRRDSSRTDVLELSKMKEISLSNKDLNYGINLDNVFWVKQDIILLQNMRISRDEELLSYILIYVLLDKDVNPSARNLDIIYGYNEDDPQNLALKVMSAIQSQGFDNIFDSCVKVFDQIELICSNNDKSLSKVLFGSYGERMIRSFQILFLSFYNLIIKEGKVISDHVKVANILHGLGTRNLHDVSSDNWNAKYRNEKISVFMTLLSPCFESSAKKDLIANLQISELENLLMNSKTENQMFDLKLGLHSLDANCSFNDECLKKIVKTLTAMANTQREIEGYVIVGVADNADDAAKFKHIYNDDISLFNTFFITGLQQEIKKKYKSLDDYFNRIKQFIEKEPVEPYTVSYILGNVRLFDYYGKDILVFKIKSSEKPLLYNNDFYERRGANIQKLEGANLLPLFERFK